MVLKILYLDDEPELCRLFSALFSAEDVEVKVFTDAREAIDEARKAPPDIAILDYRLPEMNGDRVAQLMPAEVPKYLVTGDIMIAPAYPFVAIYSKPDFIKEVQHLIDSRRAQRAGA
jgi:CheY-like chemotaxis protein